MRSPRDIVPEDELFYRQGGSEAYPDPYTSGSFRNMNPSIDPGLITNSMSSSFTNPWNDVSAAEQAKNAAGWYADTFLNTPSVAKFPGVGASYQDVLKYNTDPEVIEDLVNGISGSSHLGIKLFKNPKIAEKAKEAIEPLAGKASANRWAQRAEDVPDAYQASPGLGMLKELYDALGIKNKPELQGSFGAEIEGVSSLGRNDIQKYMPNSPHNWKLGSDSTVRGSGDFPTTYEIQTDKPFHGLEGAKSFLQESRFLRGKSGNKPLYDSGDKYGSGGHLNYSREGMSAQDAQKYIEDFVKNWESTLYPIPEQGSRRDVATYAQPLIGYLNKNPNKLYESSMGTDSFPNWNKYTAINLNHLAPGQPSSRIEERFWPGSVDPEEWLKRFILAETRMNSAVNNPKLGGWAGSSKLTKDQTQQIANNPELLVGRGQALSSEGDPYRSAINRISGKGDTPTSRNNWDEANSGLNFIDFQLDEDAVRALGNNRNRTSPDDALVGLFDRINRMRRGQSYYDAFPNLPNDTSSRLGSYIADAHNPLGPQAMRDVASKVRHIRDTYGLNRSQMASRIAPYEEGYLQRIMAEANDFPGLIEEWQLSNPKYVRDMGIPVRDSYDLNSLINFLDSRVGAYD